MFRIEFLGTLDLPDQNLKKGRLWVRFLATEP